MYFSNNNPNINGVEKIKTAVFSILKDNPNTNITITQICKHANINRSTFYAHFCDIYQMFDYFEEKLTSANFTITNTNLTQQYIIEVLKFIKIHKNFYLTYLSFPESNVMHLFGYDLSNPPDYQSVFNIAGTKEAIKLWLNNNCKDDIQNLATILFNQLT